MIIRSSAAFVGIALALAGLASPAVAAEACSVSVQAVSFGRYDPLAAAETNGVGYIELTCDAPAAATISLGPGSGTYSGRRMSNGRDSLEYDLFTSVQRAAVWGDGSAGTETVTVDGQSAILAVHGSLRARQNVGAGHYSDVVWVTVTF